MQVKVEVRGDPRRILSAELRAGRAAVTRAIRTSAADVKVAWRGAAERATGSRRLANTVRSETYPKGRQSLGAAGQVWTRAPKIMRGLTRATTIRSREGRFQAIPTPAAPKRGVGGEKISPSNFPEHRFGPLRFVFRRTGPSLLVVDAQVASISRKTGQLRGFRRARTRKATKRQGERVALRGLTTVVMFWLLPAVRTRKRIDLDRIRLRAARRLPVLIVAEWERERPSRRGAASGIGRSARGSRRAARFIGGLRG